MLKDFPNRLDSVVGGDVIDNQIDDPAPINFLAMVQRVREFQDVPCLGKDPKRRGY
jgi:hypothetical protein